MTDGVVTEKRDRCLLCGGVGTIAYRDIGDRLYDTPGMFNERLCDACGLMWLDPRPSAAELDRYYVDYMTHGGACTDGRDPMGQSPVRWRQRLRELILCGYFGYRHLCRGRLWRWPGKVMGYVPSLRQRATCGLDRAIPPDAGPDTLVVDVGCGRGDYLAFLRSAGLRVLGVEPDPLVADVLKERGLPAVHATLAEAFLETGSADQIMLVHVLEHLPHPAATLVECRRVLKPGGRLFIRTPNIASLAHRIFGRDWLHIDAPRHLHLFSGRSLRELIRECGYTRIAIRSRTERCRIVYDASAYLRRHRRLDIGHIPPAPGRSLFVWVERILCAAGVPCGEDIEVVAYR